MAVPRPPLDGPSVILADETTAALDEAARAAVSEAHSQAVRDFSVALVASGADLSGLDRPSRTRALEHGVLLRETRWSFEM